MNKTYKVPEANLNTLQVRIAKLARRCKRIGIQAPELRILGFNEVRKTNDLTGVTHIRHVFNVELDSPERPKIDGYEFIAVLSPIANDEGTVLGNVLRAVPGASVTPEERFRSASNYCDHCKTARYRLETFVITDGSTQRQIGRNCLANYLGLTNPHLLAAIAEILISAEDLLDMAEDEGGFGQGGHHAFRFPLDEVLETAASAIRNYGWLSGKSAKEFDRTSTAQRCSTWMMGDKKDREAFEHPLTISDDDKILAAETEEWLGQITDTTNDYMYNLSLLAQASSVVPKNFGIVVSAINAYSRDKERAIRRNARIESDKLSEFVGALGDRVTLENLLVVYTNKYESNWGVSTLYKLKSGENIFTYFASRDLGFDQGDTIKKFVATVKKHEVYEGVKQTVLTRGKQAPRELSKADKKAVNKLKKILKTIPYDVETYAAEKCLRTLIERIKDFGVDSIQGENNEQKSAD